MTEALLGRSVDEDGCTAYQWISEDIGGGVVLDIGCGSGPTQSMVACWVGVDRSRAELDFARARGRGPLVQASAAGLPVRDRSVDAAIAVMSLMVVRDLVATVAELVRVLRPGGTLRVLSPTDRPLTIADRVRYGLLLVALARRAMPFPHPEVAVDPRELLASAGLEIVSDERRRFRFPVAGQADAYLFVDSLYLPAVGPRRVALARAVLRSSGHGDIGIPLRRVEAQLPR